MITRITIQIAVAVIAAPVAAQWEPTPNGIGVYFDLDGAVSSHHTSAPFEQVTAYMLALNITDPSGISGWECSVVMQGAPVAPTWVVTAGLNVADMAAGLFSVGIGVAPAALPAAPEIHLATWTGFVTAQTDVVSFHVGAYPGSASFDGTPGYASGADAGVLIPFEPTPGCFGDGSAWINQDCPLAGETETWGDLKALFR